MHNIDPEEAKKALDNIDKTEGKNQINQEQEQPAESQQAPPQTSLGKGRGMNEEFQSGISGAADPGYKILPLEYLPSKGMFYPENAEITIRAALSEELRHWSTLDEHDRIDVFDMLNFILEKCVRFKIKGEPVIFTWADLLEIDRLYIIFRVHELTFPDGKNQLTTLIKCKNKSCGHTERIPIKSSMLRLYEFPTEAMQWYSPEERCFVVNSQKYNETFKLYMPTVGALQKRRKYMADLRRRRQQPDKAFVKVMPYIVGETRTLTNSRIQQYFFNYKEWPDGKFFFISEMANQLTEGKTQHFEMACPKCGETITTNIFSSQSFGVKDLFFISGRLADLI